MKGALYFYNVFVFSLFSIPRKRLPKAYISLLFYRSHILSVIFGFSGHHLLKVQFNIPLYNMCLLEQVTRSLAAKAFQTSLPLCKETFFSASMEDHVVLRFVHEHFKCYLVLQLLPIGFGIIYGIRIHVYWLHNCMSL